ncbi:MAG TPA: alpha/beta fold hydrolase, partial [Methylomirabilota bacterium]|nr:alpha/beta fold hydrolase [Methylomirabilota bacterium]
RALRRPGVLAAAVVLAAVLAATPARAADPPIVFVHGNGDTAALWTTTIWRFESNGYPRERLFALDMRFPSARSVDATRQEGRTSASEAMAQLAAFVDDVRARTGGSKVALVGNSRGANTIRNYVRFGGGAASTSHVVLGGGTNHGVIVSDSHLTGSEFNGAGELMKRLNDGPDEVVAGVAFLTVRSDRNDKYAQPIGTFINLPGVPTGLGYDAPALKGATNVVLPGADHRETSYGKRAFAETFRFITGRAPARVDITPEAEPVLDGCVTGVTAGVYDNQPVAGAAVDVYPVDPRTGSRQGDPVHHRVTGAEGRWGPFRASPAVAYEFVISAPGRPVTHIYRSPFPRGSRVVHLRPAILARDDETAAAVVVMTRPRGYFGQGRDVFTLDGAVPGGINEGVPGTSAARLRLSDAVPRSVTARFNGETIVVRTWPMADHHVAIAEFHY